MLRNLSIILSLGGLLLLLGLALAFQATGAGPLPGDLAFSRFVQTVLPPSNALFGLSTALGQVVTYLPLLAVLVALLARRWNAALLLAISGAIAVYLLEDQLKGWFPRARPSSELIQVYQALKSKSFPSGTAFRSMAVLGTGWLLCAQVWPGGPLVRALMSSCVLLILLTSLLRVWLGVHWLSDILGGWLFGGAWVLLSWAAYQFIVARFLKPAGGQT